MMQLEFESQSDGGGVKFVRDAMVDRMTGEYTLMSHFPVENKVSLDGKMMVEWTDSWMKEWMDRWLIVYANIFFSNFIIQKRYVTANATYHYAPVINSIQRYITSFNHY